MWTAREYVGPVRPHRGARWDEWCDTAADGSRSTDWRDGFNYAMQTVALWLDFQVSCLPVDVVSESRGGPALSSAGMLKSNLLGRVMRGEEIRRLPCPTHAGRLESSPVRELTALRRVARPPEARSERGEGVANSSARQNRVSSSASSPRCLMTPRSGCPSS